MAEVLMNGCEPEPWEMAALERDSRIVAGLVAENPEDAPGGRQPVTDLPGLS